MSGPLTSDAAKQQIVPASRYVLFVVIAAIGCYVDLATKRLVFQWRGLPGEQPIWWIWPNVFGIETSLNTGALFGLGTDRVLLFAFLSGVALVGIMIWFVFGRIGTDLPLTVVFGCITAGIMGNLYDRLGLWSATILDGERIHAVRDWIRFSVGEFVWPNFNIADSLLVCSAAFLIWRSFSAPAHAAAGSAPPNSVAEPVTDSRGGAKEKSSG